MGILEILAILSILAILQVGPQLAYLLYMKKAASRPWNVKIDPNYRPQVTIIVPTYQEAEVIEMKLQNLNSLEYPEDKLEVIIVDSASTDGTLDICKSWLAQNNFKFKITLLAEPIRTSKTHALNYALKHANSEVIVTTDADAILPPDVLMKAIPYLADPCVGAISGRERIVNVNDCFIAKMEDTYRNTYYTLRLGESKLHSTQIFQGEFAAYRRDVLEFFDETPGRSDDNSAVTKILRKGKRCLFIPEAVFYDAMPCNIRDYLKIKMRRASQLQKELLTRLKMWIKGELNIPQFILLANVYQHCIAPILFILSIPLAIYFMLILSNISPMLSTSLIFIIVISFLVARRIITLYIISSMILVIALLKSLIPPKPPAWEAIRSSRKYLQKLENKLGRQCH